MNNIHSLFGIILFGLLNQVNSNCDDAKNKLYCVFSGLYDQLTSDCGDAKGIYSCLFKNGCCWTEFIDEFNDEYK